MIHHPRAAVDRAGRRHVVIVTFGSLGDLHPSIAVALEMQARGHRVTIATSAFYRDRIEAAGIGFAPSRPDGDPNDRETLRRALDLKRGTEFVLRELFLDRIRESYDDLRAALDGLAAAGSPADLLVGHELAFAVPIVAEELGLPWAAAVLQPIPFFSAYDPPVLPVAQWLQRLRPLGPGVIRPFFKAARRYTRAWGEPVYALRRELGLPPGLDPIYDAKREADAVLALFSRRFAAPQPDWPPRTVVCGFPFYDGAATALSPELAAFLDAGPPPVVFTLGSSAVFEPGRFYTESAEAARRRGLRAVLLVGELSGTTVAQQWPAGLPGGIFVAEYAPFTALFPRAAAVVHQGGIGTTAQVLRAGRPALVVPWSHDQPDNAARAVRLGVARTLRRNRYTAASAERELPLLLAGPYRARAEEVARDLAAEDGVAAACDELERLAAQPRRGRATISA